MFTFRKHCVCVFLYNPLPPITGLHIAAGYIIGCSLMYKQKQPSADEEEVANNFLYAPYIRGPMF